MRAVAWRAARRRRGRWRIRGGGASGGLLACRVGRVAGWVETAVGGVEGLPEAAEGGHGVGRRRHLADAVEHVVVSLHLDRRRSLHTIGIVTLRPWREIWTVADARASVCAVPSSIAHAWLTTITLDGSLVVQLSAASDVTIWSDWPGFDMTCETTSWCDLSARTPARAMAAGPSAARQKPDPAVLNDQLRRVAPSERAAPVEHAARLRAALTRLMLGGCEQRTCGQAGHVAQRARRRAAAQRIVTRGCAPRRHGRGAAALHASSDPESTQTGG